MQRIIAENSKPSNLVRLNAKHQWSEVRLFVYQRSPNASTRGSGSSPARNADGTHIICLGDVEKGDRHKDKAPESRADRSASPAEVEVGLLSLRRYMSMVA